MHDIMYPPDGYPATDVAERPLRQAPLSLRWETRRLWPQVAETLGISRRAETLAAIALALYTEARGKGRAISYSRAKAHYTRPRRYREDLYTYRRITSAVDQLDALGLIDHDRAPPGRLGWQSAMRARLELIRHIDQVLHPGDLRLARLREPVLLRDAEKLLVDYQDTRQTDRMRKALHEQNEAIAATDFGKVLPFAGRLRRIFNGNFDHGGRFYAEGGSWQTFSKAERLQIEIAGEPVVEVDYTAFHPALAYAERGLPPHPAPYEIPGVPRPLVKVGFSIMLNSTRRNGARHELAHKPEMAAHLLGLDLERVEDPEDLPWQVARYHPEYFQSASREADRLIDALLTMHHGIADRFFTGAGLRLQRLDSEIADGVMRKMRRRGILVLPVHDSFLAPASRAELLEEVMVEEAARRGASVCCKRSSFISSG